MRTLALTLLIVAPRFAGGEPLSETGIESKRKLEALKKRLPVVVETGLKDLFPPGYTHVVRVQRVRALAETEAKVVIHIYFRDDGTKVLLEIPQRWAVLRLHFYDGRWTCDRIEWDSEREDLIPDAKEAGHSLMEAIDEETEK